MPTVDIHPTSVTVRLSRFEKVFGLLRDLTIPRGAITSATYAEHGLRALRGLRAPGLGMPGVAAIGTWRGRGYKDYVVARRGPAVVLELTGHKYGRVVLTLENAKKLADKLSPK